MGLFNFSTRSPSAGKNQKDINFGDLLDEFDKLEPCEKRSRSETYYEIVFLNSDKNKFNKLLSDNFGPAAKPAGKDPTQEDQELTKTYGGIWDSQTLYKKEFSNGLIITMLWPWQDNKHTTIKMNFVPK